MSYNDLSSAEQDILLELYEGYADDIEILFAADVNDFPTKPYGGSNPYHYCKYCHTSIIDININNDQHPRRCTWVISYKDFEMLKAQLPKNVSDNIRDYFDEITYE